MLRRRVYFLMRSVALSPADFDKWLREKQAEQKLADVAPNAPAVTASAAPAAAIAQ